MSILLAIVIAVIQGVTELFPVSSLGHAVILPGLFNLGIDQKAPEFLPFLVVLHLGTAAALLAYFWRDWLGLGLGLVARDPDRRARAVRTLVLVAAATVPAAVIGYFLNHLIRDLFGVPVIAAAFLFANGFVLFLGERMKRRAARTARGGSIDTLSLKGALAIGLWQCGAFLPGISRSGTTIVGGLLAGLNHKAAAHFSFLIATPVILGAAILEVPKLLRQGAAPGMLQVSLVGGAVAAVTAYASIAFLMRYFGKQEFEALDPFAYYCWLAGGGAALWLLLA